MLKMWRLHCLHSHLTPATPFDSFTAAPIFLKSLLSALVGTSLPFCLVQWDIFTAKLIWQIQQAPECAHLRFRRAVQMPHWLWWVAPSANSMWWNYTLSFCVTQLEQHKREKHRWPTSQGGRAGTITPSSSVPGIPFHCPGMALSALFTFLLLNFKLARKACKLCFPSKDLALRDTWAHLIGQRQSVVANSSCFILVWNALKQDYR